MVTLAVFGQLSSDMGSLHGERRKIVPALLSRKKAVGRVKRGTSIRQHNSISQECCLPSLVLAIFVLPNNSKADLARDLYSDNGQ